VYKGDLFSTTREQSGEESRAIPEIPQNVQSSCHFHHHICSGEQPALFFSKKSAIILQPGHTSMMVMRSGTISLGIWRELLRITMFALKRRRAGMDAEHRPRPRAGKRSRTIFGGGAATIALLGGRASTPKMVLGATAAREPRGSEDLRRRRLTGRTTTTDVAADPSDHAERGRRPKGSADFGKPYVADRAVRSSVKILRAYRSGVETPAPGESTLVCKLRFRERTNSRLFFDCRSTPRV
jgi:hypothetical protein